MSPLLSTLFFAAAAAAEVTTSIWMPSPYQDDTHIGFYASVVGVDGDKTTLALQFDDTTDLKTAGYEIPDEPNTMTFLGNSRFESVQTITEFPGGPVRTAGYGCELTTGSGASVGAACRFSSNGPAVYSSVCDQYTDDTNDHTRIPSYCKSGSTLPDSVVAHTYTIGKEDIATYQVVITAGEEKLSATAGATPTSSEAVVTGTGAFSLHRGQNVAPTGVASALPQEAGVETSAETGAAGTILPLHPALAGLGVVAMALLL